MSPVGDFIGFFRPLLAGSSSGASLSRWPTIAAKPKARNSRTRGRADQRRVLIVVLVINAVMFLAEFGGGPGRGVGGADGGLVPSRSAIPGPWSQRFMRSRRATGGAGSPRSGRFHLLLGLGPRQRRTRSRGVAQFDAELAFGGPALVANLVCLRMLWRFRRQDVNMASTWECSRNDVISNVGALAAGADGRDVAVAGHRHRAVMGRWCDVRGGAQRQRSATEGAKSLGPETFCPPECHPAGRCSLTRATVSRDRCWR